jgi:D-ribose pyranose/furanose isomerase RbsD
MKLDDRQVSSITMRSQLKVSKSTEKTNKQIHHNCRHTTTKQQQQQQQQHNHHEKQQEQQQQLQAYVVILGRRVGELQPQAD